MQNFILPPPQPGLSAGHPPRSVAAPTRKKALALRAHRRSYSSSLPLLSVSLPLPFCGDIFTALKGCIHYLHTTGEALAQRVPSKRNAAKRSEDCASHGSGSQRRTETPKQSFIFNGLKISQVQQKVQQSVTVSFVVTSWLHLALYQSLTKRGL